MTILSRLTAGGINRADRLFWGGPVRLRAPGPIRPQRHQSGTL